MMNRMIVGNLVHRPIRSLISIVAVALEVTMILLIVGLSLGMLQDTRTRTAGIGADVLARAGHIVHAGGGEALDIVDVREFLGGRGKQRDRGHRDERRNVGDVGLGVEGKAGPVHAARGSE